MKPKTKSFRAPFAITLGLGLVLMSPAAAGAADPDPVGDLATIITTVLTPPEPVTTAVEVPPPSNDSDSTGNETVDPVAPDHGSTKGVEATLAGNDVAGISQDNATINDDDSTTADSTLLSLGGTEVLGAHADSTGTTSDSFDPFAPLTGAVCDGSAGGVCLQVLYAFADASDDGTTSESRSRSGIAKACLGGTSTDTADPCSGLSIGVATSDAQADRDQATGQTTASSEYRTADVCGGADETGCTGGRLTALSSEGQADSGDGSTPASASRSSSVLGYQMPGGEPTDYTTPTDLSIFPECDPGVVCLFLNQGETYLGDGVAGHAQDALKLTVLPGVLDLYVGIGRTETLVHNDGGEEPPNPPKPPKPPTDDDGDDNDDNSMLLPDTGGPRAGLLGIALLGIAVGSFVVAAGRRQTGAVV